MDTESVRIPVDVLERYRKLSEETRVPVTTLIRWAMQDAEKQLHKDLEKFKKGEKP